MKIRSDFVTNSSSSSFILAFKSAETYIDELNISEEAMAEYRPYYEDVIKDIPENIVDKNSTIEEYRDEIYYQMLWEFESELERKREMSYREIRKAREEDWFKKELEKRIDNEIKTLEEALKDKEYVARVEYGDGGYGQDGVLEHQLVPELECCIANINHH